MGDAEISSEFEYSASFLRILIPGIIAVTIASILLVLNYSSYILIFKESIGESIWVLLPIGVIFVLISMFVGLIINVFNTRLTRILEGYPIGFLDEIRKKVPQIYHRLIKKEKNQLDVHQKKIGILKRKQWEKYDRYRTTFKTEEPDSIEKASAYTNLISYYSHCLDKKTKDPNSEDEDLKELIMPTELGNVFRSMATYPEMKYGMDGIFFWSRIQFVIPPENKPTLDKMRAFVDMFVELTWIFIFAAVIYSITLAYTGKYFYSLVSLFIFVIFSLSSYNMAVQSALDFGSYFRSIFDLYRGDLWEKIKHGRFDKLEGLPEKEKWENIFNALWFHNTIQCQNCSRFYEIIYLFGWNNIPGKDNQRLKRFLKNDFGIEWVEGAEIKKTPDNRTIHIFNKQNSAKIMFDKNKEKAALKINEVQTSDLLVKEDNSEFYIYSTIGHQCK